ncbi:hypothetical protein AOLI_G00062360 [Acnodon oligacanthus]
MFTFTGSGLKSLGCVWLYGSAHNVAWNTAFTVNCGKCSKTCKDKRGLKIHQSQTNCGKEGSQMFRTAVAPGKTQENSRQEAPHSTGDRLAPVSPQDLRMDPPDATPESQPHHVRE